jgi:serine-type D-Ala-D-Ala carboxypeptidase/endopeptidase (penicillin-binding protein 4)
LHIPQSRIANWNERAICYYAFPVRSLNPYHMKFARLILTFQPIYLAIVVLSAQIAVNKSASAQNTPSPTPVNLSNSPVCLAELPNQIQKITTRPLLAKARWGIAVDSLSSGKTLYSQERNKYFIPASNVKLLTSAAALTRLKPEFRIRTSIYTTDSEGRSLLLVGRGDPSFSNPQLRELVTQLQAKNYRQIDRLTLSDRYFQGTTIHPTWEWEDVQYYYGTTVNSLILNQNAVDLTVSPQTVGVPLKYTWSDRVAVWDRKIINEGITTEANVPANLQLIQIPGKSDLKIQGQLPVGNPPESESLAIIDPAKYFTDSFNIALRSQDIIVKEIKPLLATETVTPQTEVAFVESPPLADLVMEVNQNSNNLYAEVLLRTLGASDRQNSQEDPSILGLAAIQETLKQIGVDPKTYKIVDGSGLSRHNLVSPESLIQTLKAMDKSPYAQIYRQSLPASGVNGTLKNRFGGVENLIQAKTGTMTGVSALSGYITPQDYEPLVFSIIVNQSDQKAIATRQAIDEVVVLLTRLRSCQ